MRMTVRVEGMNAIIDKVRRMMETTRPKVVMAALEAGGEVIAEEAKRLVPVRTGTLRDSIVVSTEALNYSGVTLSRGQFSVHVGPQQGSNPDGFYGHMVEFGTFRTAPHPFMRPALDNVGDEASAVVAEHLGVEFMRLARD